MSLRYNFPYPEVTNYTGSCVNSADGAYSIYRVPLGQRKRLAKRLTEVWRITHHGLSAEVASSQARSRTATPSMAYCSVLIGRPTDHAPCVTRDRRNLGGLVELVCSVV